MSLPAKSVTPELAVDAPDGKPKTPWANRSEHIAGKYWANAQWLVIQNATPQDPATGNPIGEILISADDATLQIRPLWI